MKIYSLKFWIIFWIIAAFLLLGWYVFSQVIHRNFENLKPFVRLLPIGAERREELEVLADIYQKTSVGADEKHFLLLFQNDMELRPGGGFIGSFGVLTLKNGRISNLEIHDTGVFDGNIPDGIAPPAPIADSFHIGSWKMRDSNWSPDFAVNAAQAENFYRLGGGSEAIDGVVAINTDVLNSILSITGPVKMADYPGEYNNETAILQLEYQVEKGYREQGIEKGERKSVMRAMAATLMEKIRGLSVSQHLRLAEKIEMHLKQKDIQMFFKDEKLQAEAEGMNWGGRTKDYSGDYLAVVDANLNSLKSDLCIKRSLDYQIDFRTARNASQSEAGGNGDPQATLKVTYEHTCRTRDWLTTNYYDWQRVYVPAGATLVEGAQENQGVEASEDLGKTVFAREVYVPIGETRTFTLKYNLPASPELQRGESKETATANPYKLLVQKQSGSGELPARISVLKNDGREASKEEIITGDREFSF